MKKFRIGKFIKEFRVGRLSLFFGEVLLLIFAPTYQFVDYLMNETPGDGVKIYGDNPVFKNVLGIKTVEYRITVDGKNIARISTSIKSPPWMRSLGAPNQVVWGKSARSVSRSSQIFWIVLVRILIKMIPFILIFITWKICEFNDDEEDWKNNALALRKPRNYYDGNDWSVGM